jgi:hypothetical protein
MGPEFRFSHERSSAVSRRVLRVLFAALIAITLTIAASAEGAKAFRAARLTFLEGEVHVERANGSAKDTAVLNMPLLEGSVISTAQDGQAEIEFEDGSLVRLTPNSGLSLVNLSADSSGNFHTRMSLIGGLAYLELRAGTKYQYSLDAGGDVISPIENATIRVNLDEPPAIVSVLDGSAHIASAHGSDADATAGQTIRTDAASEGGVYMIKQAIAPESWDQWNEDRDEAAATQAGSQTAARQKFAGDQGYGWSDLDANGSWYDVPGHGEVWQPYIAQPADTTPDDGDQSGPAGALASSFDPYGFGSWVYTPAGYGWASGYGWGWLPYRCGTWSYWDNFGWGWSPGYGCDLLGYGGYGYGLNFGRVPRFYHRPGRPVPGPAPIHPVLKGRGAPVPLQTASAAGGARVIAGNTVQPLPPIGGGYTPRGGLAVGSGLRKDYPIDTATHEPVLGLEATHTLPTYTSHMRAAWQPSGRTPASGPQSVSVQRPIYNPANPAATRIAPVSRPAPSNQSYRPAPSYAPTQRQPAAAPSYSPPAPASHASPSSPSSSHGH